MQTFASDLHTKVRLTPEVSKKLASNIAAEVRFLSAEQKAEIKAASPVPLADRLTELQTFQKWMEQSGRVKNNPFVTRASLDTKLYLFCLSSRGMFSSLGQGMSKRFCH